ncbi:HsmA family protein [Sporomusa sp.]|uniref:HsmA family protein n=1 Tax=Sporomusa sp. TaxID=2078658 RepID=UPI002C2B182D|nr:HsmA family protein [Sporomusa sp.]HWR42264.1 HsmA family protein [Sporomusa sp.]
MLIIAISFISLAGLLYTLAVFAEKTQKILNWWHVVVFWIGLAFDSIGTTAMSNIAGRFQADFHGLTGLFAILLMFIHTLWATWVLHSENNHLKVNFHKLSIFVWLIWLIPMFSGLLFSAFKIH